jgi:hypothetical protein
MSVSINRARYHRYALSDQIEHFDQADTDMRCGKRRRIIETIANHADTVVPGSLPKIDLTTRSAARADERLRP